MNFTDVSPIVNIVNAIALILTILIIVRIALSWLGGGVSSQNPLIQVVIGIVDPILKPFRKILPPFGGIDFSPLLALLVINVIQGILGNILTTGEHRSIAYILLAIVYQVLTSVDLFICVFIGLRLILVALQSSPFHPANMFMRQLTDPFVRPFRRFTKGGTAGAIVAFVFYVIFYVVLVNVGGSVVLATQ